MGQRKRLFVIGLKTLNALYEKGEIRDDDLADALFCCYCTLNAGLASLNRMILRDMVVEATQQGRAVWIKTERESIHLDHYNRVLGANGYCYLRPSHEVGPYFILGCLERDYNFRVIF